jgi:serine protease inhibitor
MSQLCQNLMVSTRPNGSTDIPSANNQFALKFYSKISQDKQSNVFFSPTSLFDAFDENWKQDEHFDSYIPNDAENHWGCFMRMAL